MADRTQVDRLVGKIMTDHEFRTAFAADPAAAARAHDIVLSAEQEASFKNNLDAVVSAGEGASTASSSRALASSSRSQRDPEGRAPVNVALISMPWNDPYMPSLQLAALKAWVEREVPGTSVNALHYYFELAEIIDIKLAHAIATCGYFLGEALFAYELFPETRAEILRYIDAEKAKARYFANVDFPSQVIEPLVAAMRRRAETIDWSQYKLIGFSLVFAQTMASLLMARLIKERFPDVPIVLGGPSAIGAMGRGLLRGFPEIGMVVNGEGEVPLTALVRRLAEGAPVEGIPGVVTRDTPPERVHQLDQMSAMTSLPTPDFHPYFDLVSRSVLRAVVQKKLSIGVESSRGCWWDRSHIEDRLSCSFCNLNLQWRGYREKSIDRFVSELEALSEEHSVRDFLLVDNILRYQGVEELCERLAALPRPLNLAIEARASVKPSQMLLLSKAGVKIIQFGIEALSTEVLRVIYKGTTTIQNVQAMKFSERFGLRNSSNIITSHPGVGPEAVRETLQNMDWVTCYVPLLTSPFVLSYQSPIYKNPTAFGVRRVRNLDALTAFLPPEHRDVFFWQDQSFDCDISEETAALWGEVNEAADRWRALRERQTRRYGVSSLLLYQDHGTSLEITDYRSDPPRTVVLDDISRRLHFICDEAHLLETVVATLSQLGGPSPEPPSEDEVLRRLKEMVAQRVMFREGSRFLSLAIPADPAERMVYTPVKVVVPSERRSKSSLLRVVSDMGTPA